MQKHAALAQYVFSPLVVMMYSETSLNWTLNKQLSFTVDRMLLKLVFKNRKEVFYLTTHSTHLVTVIWRGGPKT